MDSLKSIPREFRRRDPQTQAERVARFVRAWRLRHDDARGHLRDHPEGATRRALRDAAGGLPNERLKAVLEGLGNLVDTSGDRVLLRVRSENHVPASVPRDNMVSPPCPQASESPSITTVETGDSACPQGVPDPKAGTNGVPLKGTSPFLSPPPEGEETIGKAVRL